MRRYRRGCTAPTTGGSRECWADLVDLSLDKFRVLQGSAGCIRISVRFGQVHATSLTWRVMPVCPPGIGCWIRLVLKRVLSWT